MKDIFTGAAIILIVILALIVLVSPRQEPKIQEVPIEIPQMEGAL